MTIHRFAHADAASLQEVVAALDETCLPLGGGTDLVAMMKAGLMAPERLVNLKTLPDHHGVRPGDGGWRIGALMTLADLAADPAVAEAPALASLVEAVLDSASPQLRTMATLGGNLLQRPRCWYFRNPEVPCWRKGGRRCFAFRGENKYHTLLGGGPCYAPHPSDPAVALLALGAAVRLSGPAGDRTLALDDFYVTPTRDAQRADGYHPVTVLAPDEVLVEVLIPGSAANARSAYVKLMERGVWDFALVSVAVNLALSDAGQVAAARVALGGVAAVPWRATEAEEALLGGSLTPEAIDRAAEAVVAGTRPLEHNAYKVDQLKAALRQALRRWTAD